MSPIKYSGGSDELSLLNAALQEFVGQPGEFIATSVLPKLTGLNREQGTIKVKKRTNLRIADTKHANGGFFNRIGMPGHTSHTTT